MRRWTAEVQAGIGSPGGASVGEDEAHPRGLVVTIEIVDMDGEFFLLRKDAGGKSLSDTWHVSLEEAVRQAEFEFGVTEDEWMCASSDSIDLVE